MANINLPKFDIKKIRTNPAYKNLLEELNKNPIEAFKQYTVLEETSNPITLSEGGMDLIKDIKSNLKINQSDLDKVFESPQLTPEMQAKINEKPEEAYKLAYNAYKYGDSNTESKLQLRGLMSSLKNDLISKGKNPDKIINDNSVMKALNFVGNVVNVPPALLAKGYASLYGQSDKVKIWGGNAWEDALRAININPEMQKLIQKKAKNIPLVANEEKKVKEFDDKYAGWGLLWNIVGDPIILAGAIGKGLSLASRGLRLIEGMEGLAKATGTVGKIGEAISAPLQTFKNAKKIAEFEKSGELLNTFRNNLTNFKNKLDNILDESEKLKINDLIKSEKIDPKDYFNITDSLVAKARVEGKNDIVNRILQTNDKLTSTMSEMKDLSESKIYQGLSRTDDKINKLIEGAGEKIGIRKVLVSDVPLKSQTVDELIKNPKEFIDKARRMGQGAFQIALKTQYKITKLIDKQLIPEIMKSKNVLNNFGLEIGKTYKYKDLQNVITQLIERPEISKKLKFDNKTISMINDIMDDYIIEEAKVIGSKAMPLLSKNKKNTWKKLSEKYKTLNIENEYHPELPGLKTEMKKLLKERTSKGTVNTEDVLDVSDTLGYLTHILTPEAKKIVNQMESPIRNKFNASFKSFVTNPSYKQRFMEGSISEINNKIKNGKIIEEIDEVINNSPPEEWKQLDEMKDYFDKFKGVDFFNTDVKQLIGIRGARMSKTIMQGIFYNGIKQFGFPKKTVIDGITYINPHVKGIIGLSEMYFHPDIAKAIDRIYEYTENPNKLLNILKSFQGFWKVLQLSYPSTVLRNMIGNILNSFLVIQNPLKYIESWKDAVFGIAGKNYDIITSTGKIIPLQDLLKYGIERGLTGSTLKKIDIDQVQNETENIGSGILNNTAKGIDHITTMFQKFPATGWTAKGNDIIEGTSKLALFIQSVKEGMSFDQAAENTYKALFDYSDTTQLAKGVRNVVPFFVWTLKNLPLQLGNLLSIPSKIIIKTEENINENRSSDKEIDKRFQSEYLKNAPNISVGEESGKPQYVLLEGLLPLFDLSKIARIYTGDLNIIFDDMLKDITPMIKTPVELATNRSFATHKDLSKSQYGTTEYLGLNISPKLKAVLDDWRIFGTANKGINIAKLISKESMSVMPDKNIGKMIFSWALMSPIDYDINYSKIIESSNFKNKLDTEINDFYGYSSKVKKTLLNGEQFPEKIYKNRISLILNLIIRGYKEGKLSNKDINNFGKKLYGAIKQ